MVDAFAEQADFSGMTPESVFITGIAHQAFVKVDEGGTEAAAATAVVHGTKSAGDVTMDSLRVDRPFIFGILDQPTGEFLFMGRIMNPQG